MGLSNDDIPELVSYAERDLSALSNPRKASAEDYAAMIAEAM
jgi:alcohol dehydrogenase class IV